MRMEARYELFDHTADIGARVVAPTLDALARTAVEALYGVIGSLAVAGARESARFAYQGDDAAVIIRDWLADLLVEFESHGRRLTDVVVESFDGAHLRAAGVFRAIDASRSEFHREVKAVTYHELALRTVDGGYELVFIVDI